MNRLKVQIFSCSIVSHTLRQSLGMWMCASDNSNTHTESQRSSLPKVLVPGDYIVSMMIGYWIVIWRGEKHMNQNARTYVAC